VYAAAEPDYEHGIVNLLTGQKDTSVEFGTHLIGFNANSTIMASVVDVPGYISRQVLFTDLATGNVLAQMNFFGGTRPAFDRNGDLLIIGGVDDEAPNPDNAFGLLFFFNFADVLISQEVDRTDAIRFESLGHDWPTVTEFSPDYRLLAVVTGGELSLWGVSAE
ncbi:MAG: hypothetical protein CUN54_09265, partial [Phototrophicales bacterium]